MKQEIHPIQARILRTMLFREKSRFADLNTLKLPTDHFNFHLKQLLALRLVEKSADNKYGLTAKGKEFANRFDTEKIAIEKQAKIGVVVCLIRKQKGIVRYLIQQRLKQPYFGYYGYITGKIKWGETLMETAARELKEETGLKAKLTLVSILHKMDYPIKGEILEDKFFFVIRAENPIGKLIENIEGGRNTWLTEKEVLKLPDVFPGVKERLKSVFQNQLTFSEKKYKVKNY